jgi:DNA end-binding protein Ku
MPSVSWKGHIRLSLVSIPVKAYLAVDSDADEIHFNQLHKTCNSRIKYVKTCPVHGPVRPDEIVLGYEYEKNRYVVVDKNELESLQSSEEKIVSVETIVPLDAIDPLYLTDRTSYLVPDGPAGQKPYSVIQQAILDQGVAMIGRQVRNGKDCVVMIRARDHMLTMTALSNAEQVRDAGALAGELPAPSASEAELKLTKTLFEAYSAPELDVAQIRGHYAERVRELVEAKLAGQEIVQAATVEAPQVINLMDALRKSVASARTVPKNPTSRKAAKPARASRPRRKSG